jgi:hypothetical protein
MSPQFALIIALLALLALGVGAIALLAVVTAKTQERKGPAPTTTELPVDEAMELYHQHRFLRRHPEWEGRDYRADRSSPWYTDPEFNSNQGTLSKR